MKRAEYMYLEQQSFSKRPNIPRITIPEDISDYSISSNEITPMEYMTYDYPEIKTNICQKIYDTIIIYLKKWKLL